MKGRLCAAGALFGGIMRKEKSFSRSYNYTRYKEYNQVIVLCYSYYRGDNVITYAPFYRTLLRRNITEYHLIFKEGFSASTLHRMKHGKPITTKTLDSLCDILECEISDVIERTVE